MTPSDELPARGSGEQHAMRVDADVYRWLRQRAEAIADETGIRPTVAQVIRQLVRAAGKGQS